MKVMCILDSPWVSQFGIPIGGPSYLEECIVDGEFDMLNKKWYILPKYVQHANGYCAEFFIPLSDIDETELVKEREMVEV